MDYVGHRKKKTRAAHVCHRPRCSAMPCCETQYGASNNTVIRNSNWGNDLFLKNDLDKYVRLNLKEVRNIRLCEKGLSHVRMEH